MPDPTASEISASLKQLDVRIVHLLDEFASDTGIDIADLIIRYDYDNHAYVMDYRLAFPEE